MAALIGLLVGGLLGHALANEWGALIGGLLGFFVGVLIAASRQRTAHRKPEDAMIVRAGASGAGPDPAVHERIAQLEARVATLEAALRSGASAVSGVQPWETSPASPRVAMPVAPQPGSIPVPAAPMPETGASAAAAQATAAPTTASAAAVSAAQATASVADAAVAAAEPSAPATPEMGVTRAGPTPTNRLWAWFTGGNALTRIGVVVLFFGVAFLLRYFTEHFTVPIEVRLALVAVGGAALIALGLALARTRAGYGLSLQGAGAGVLYLTTFAALRLYSVLPGEAAMALLVVIAGLTVYLAVRADSQALAGLALAGGFLAPLLTATRGAPLPLFGYVAILNGAIFALASRRVWRALNTLGFVCTFGLGLFWGARYYTSEHFATVEPFLILFFAYYVIIAILEARRGTFAVERPVDGLLVFGVPIGGFVLQAELVAEFEHGAAWSAVAVALVYAGLYAALRRHALPALALLARAFLALAVIFATLAVPLAFDDEWTAALWAIEAAGVYWMGVRQASPVARAFALLIEAAAGVAFIHSGGPSTFEPIFANGHFIGAMLIALSGLATAFFADRTGPGLPARERPVTAFVFAWGAIWWLAAGGTELVAHVGRAREVHAALAWVVVSVALALALSRVLRWSRLATTGVALLPVMIVAAIGDFERARTTLTDFGWLVWPAAWLTHAFALRTADANAGADDVAGQPSGTAAVRRSVHAISAVAFVAQVSWEGSEWAGRWTPAHTVWVACAAALPVSAYLWLVRRCADARVWPFAAYAQAYTVDAGRAVMAMLVVWFFAVNVFSPGDVSPLPYLPLLNPLDITLALALGAAFTWARRFLPLERTMLYGWLGAGLFVALNGVVLRTGHHWLDIPWRLSSLLASKPLQAALTLTWTVTALAVMLIATRRGLRPLWMTGAALLAVVVGKLFLIDLGALSGLPRVVSFLGVGLLLLAIGYVSPLPPASRDDILRKPDIP